MSVWQPIETAPDIAFVSDGEWFGLAVRLRSATVEPDWWIPLGRFVRHDGRETGRFRRIEALFWLVVEPPK